MSETFILFSDHDKLRTLFGAKDENLRRVRESVGIDVVIRGDELRLSGDESRIHRGREIIEELQKIIDRKGILLESEVTRVLAGDSVDTDVDRPRSGNDLAHLSASKKVRPRSAGQEAYLRCMRENDLVFCAGPAGCGKTYLAVAMAVAALRSEQARKIVLVRPAVEAGEKLGFLPGDVFAKVHPYLRPLLDALNDILDNGNGAQRQREVYQQTGDMRDVVTYLIEQSE